MRFKVDRARAYEGVQNTEQRTSGLILFHFGGDRPPSVLARARVTQNRCVWMHVISHSFVSQATCGRRVQHGACAHSLCSKDGHRLLWSVNERCAQCAVLLRAGAAGTWHTPGPKSTYSTPRRERWLLQQRLRPVALPLFFDHVLSQTYTLTRPEAPHPRLHLRTRRASARFPSRRSGIPSRWPP